MTGDDVSPAEAARIASGADPSDVAVDAAVDADVDADANSTQSSKIGSGSDRFSSLVDGLRSTDPHPELDDVGSLLDGLDNPDRLLARGIAKIGGVDSREAWVDLLRALVGFSRQQTRDADAPDSGADPDGAGVDEW